MKLMVSFTVTYEVSALELEWKSKREPTMDRVAELLEKQLPNLREAADCNVADICIYQVERV